MIVIIVMIKNFDARLNNTSKLGYRYAIEYKVPKKAPIHFLFLFIYTIN